MGSLPPEKAGVGSAVNDTARELGGTLGVAIVGSLFASVYASRLGELLAGFRRGTRLQRNLDDLQTMLDLPQVRVVDVSTRTADRYGRIEAILRRRGRPIPPNDIWIAATASDGEPAKNTSSSFFNADRLAETRD